MNIQLLKDKLLEKIAAALESDHIETVDRLTAIYNTLCHADTQSKMTEAAIHGDVNPFGGLEE